MARMADELENSGEGAAAPSDSSLADAIAAHLALKKEHGADPNEVEHELEDALSPPTREPEPEPEPAAVEPPPVVEPEPAPEPEPVAAEPAPEPDPEPEPEPEPVATEPPPAPEPEPAPEHEPAPEPEPAVEEPAAAKADQPAPGEITGTIEFEFGAEGEAEAEPAEEPVADHDLLEETPDFFEETPEHDKLWFDEAPPRKFDF
jgi:hypothetical protein